MAIATLLLLAGCQGDAQRAMNSGALAQQQLEAGQLGEARRTIAEAVKQRDDIVALQLLRGRIELASGSQAAAFDAYSAALALEAANPEALQGVAQLGLRTGHLRESEDAVERILALDPSQPDALLVKALLAVVRNRPQEAIEISDRVLEGDPGSEAGAVLKSRALYLAGKPREAMAQLDNAAARSPETELIAQTRLELHREASNAAGMLASFKVLRRFKPKDVELRIDEANLRYKTGDVAGARALLRDAMLVLQPDRDQRLRITQLWLTYDDEPLTEQDRAKLPQMRDEGGALETARYYLDTGRASIALSVLAGRTSPATRALEARARLSVGETLLGSRLAERVLARDSTQCDALLARSAVRLRQGRVAQAVLAAQTAAAECPQEPAAAMALARAYEGSRTVAGARRAYADGVKRMPQNAELSAAFVAWLERRREVRQAVAEARRLTRKAPALVRGWEAYLDLCRRHGDVACASAAQTGLVVARGNLAIDPPGGELPPKGLVGRLRKKDA